MMQKLEDGTVVHKRRSGNEPAVYQNTMAQTNGSAAVDITNDPVNHPSHYTAGRIEVIDFLEDQKFPYHLGNAVKYICRAGKKDPAKTEEDLRKAIWYIDRYIGLLKKEGGSHEG